MPMFHVVLTRSGPEYDLSRPLEEQSGWDEHAAFMDGLAAAGTVLFGGPVGDGEDALVLVDAPDEEAVHATLADDPWTGTILETGSVVPWTIWVDGRSLRRD